MTPLGIGIVGTGNIAGGYARDALTHPEIRLIAATDLDPVRLAAFAESHAVRGHPSLDDLLADDHVDIVVNLTVHHAHYEVTKRALDAGRHVYSEKPLALRTEEARELAELAVARGLRLGCSPSTFLGEAQQTSAGLIRSGRLGTVRAVYSEVNWGRIETWHPAPAPFFEVGVRYWSLRVGIRSRWTEAFDGSRVRLPCRSRNSCACDDSGARDVAPCPQ